jgi:hypothetical protein
MSSPRTFPTSEPTAVTFGIVTSEIRIGTKIRRECKRPAFALVILEKIQLTLLGLRVVPSVEDISIQHS